MRKNIAKIFTLVCLVCVVSACFKADIVVGQSDDSYSPSVNREIKSINGDIADKQTELKKIKQQQQVYSNAIAQKQQEKSTLNNELAILDNKAAKAELDIEMVQTDIERIGLEIKKTDVEIDNKSAEIDKEKEQIADLLSLIYKRDNISSLEIMLVNDSLADFLSQAKYLEDINQGVKESLDNVKKMKNDLENEKTVLDGQNKDLVAMKEDLEEKKLTFASEQDNKKYLLEQVNDSESQYQRLLAEAKRQQEQAAADIASMEKLVRAKVAKLNGSPLQFNDNGLIWPVPKNTITAYFHDPDYPFRAIFEHPAVDIRAGQGTPISAAASGYVARTQYGHNGAYGYIMLIHGDGLATVYGHVSKIYVKEDEYVVQGQTIGLSGGMPGADGSGPLTTGPHLHFEVRLNGIPVDPLSYLP